MAPPTWVVGQVLTAADVNSWFVPLTVTKTADQSVTSSTALVNDTALSVTVAANATYQLMDCVLFYNGAAQGTADLKFQFTGPAGSTLNMTALAFPTSGGFGGTVFSGITGLSATRTAGTNGSSNTLPALLYGTLVTTATAGTFQLQWAQNTSNATATIIKAGSVLTLYRVS